MTTNSDHHIASAFIKGDPETYRLVMSWIKASVDWIARGSTIDKDELVGECVEALCRAIQSGRYRGSGLRSYINVICSNKFVDWINSRNRTEYRDQETLENTPGESPNPEDKARSILRVARLRAALMRLDPDDRLAVMMRALGREYQEIASRLNTTPGATRKRVCEARQRLAAILDGDSKS